MTFIEESLKFMIMGFFKRCRIITQILVSIKERFATDTRESIFSEALSHNLRWCFVTIQTCIKKGDEDREYIGDDGFEEGFAPKQGRQVLNKLNVFRRITDTIVTSLDAFITKG